MRNHARARAFTLIELLVSIAILGVLISLLLPALGRARDQTKRTQCASNMRSIGQALFTFAGDNHDRLPLNARPWDEVECAGGGVGLQSSYRSDKLAPAWIWQIHRVLGRKSSPWLTDLRCPTAALTFPAYLAGRAIVDDGSPGSCWLLNAYCSARLLSSIPSPASGVMVHEGGLWESMSLHTTELEFPGAPWRYPHPRVGFEKAATWDDWLPGRPQRPSRNILWCDGHMDTRVARSWPEGFGSHDPDRIKHMRFGLPGDNPTATGRR